MRPLNLPVSLLVASLLACDQSDPETEDGSVAEQAVAQASSDELPRFTLEWPEVGGVAALNADDLDAWVGGPVGDALTERLDELSSLPSSELARLAGGRAAQIVLQNDLWGLWQRLGEVDPTSPNVAELRRLAGDLVATLALERPNGDGQIPAIPVALAGVLEGYTLAESELPILQHELAFGARRVFHLAFAGQASSRRALYSTLVALDPEGIPYETAIAGDLEMLEFQADELVDARVFELRRELLSVAQSTHSMEEVAEVARVPGLGANHAVAIVSPPQPLSALPCASCHRDSTMMSLPSERYQVGNRTAGVLAHAAMNAPPPASSLAD